MLDERLIKVLDMASRESTNENEAINALRAFRKRTDVLNLNFEDMLTGRARPVGNSEATTSLSSVKTRVRALEGEVSELTLEKDSLLKSNLNLMAQLRAAEKKLLEVKVEIPVAPVAEVVDPFSFDAFDKALTVKLTKKWRAVMSAQTRYSYADFRNWETDKKVPSEVFDIIGTLTPVKAPSFKWDDNPDAVRRVFELKEGGIKTRDIAAHISKEFNVELKPTAVKFCLQMKRAA